MNTKINIFLILYFCILSTGYSQEKSRKQLKEEGKIAQQQKIDSLINSKEFVFVASFANPQGYKTVNLASNPNFVKFYPDSISSDMPYYGRSYGSAGYGGDGGMKFAGKANDYKITKEKKNYQISARVKGERDVYDIFLSVSFSGSASLSINCNNRSSISYNGEISAIEKPK
jgi:hypothetical protein